MPIDATNPAQQAALNKALAASRVGLGTSSGNVFDSLPDRPKKVLFNAQGPGGVNGIVVPRHMWEGNDKVKGMRDINTMRAQVYGPENRDPLSIGKVGKVHKQALDEHFSKPVHQQVADEEAALQRLRAAGHIGHKSDTLDESEKLDTVNHERDEKGRTYVGYASKGVAGHSLYSSGVGENHKLHVINTCPGQTTGCGGGTDEHGIVDTSKGTCFAPNAESQYINASIRRACHEQAKHDPAMTKDWILAHTGSLRRAANNADRKNKVTLFRPNVVDETDVSSRHVINGLNKQRAAAGKPKIIANSYGKTNEMHDPENGYYVTHSNVGPKAKLGASISQNISRDKQRINSTIHAADSAGNDFVNENGNKTPPKNSYMVTDVKRGSAFDKRMQKTITHAKYWSTGLPPARLSAAEKAEGPEGHFDGNGKPTTPGKAHYGHETLNGLRYDYQKQHILHPRLVQVGHNEDGTKHMIPTDSRFKDDDFLPRVRFKTKNGKRAGAILMTTPTESTSNSGHQSAFTHHVGEEDLKHAIAHNGEYEIDSPYDQEATRGIEYQPPKAKKAFGGSIESGSEDDEELSAFPERSFSAQKHNAHRHVPDEDHEMMPSSRHSGSGPLVDHALQMVAHLTKQR